MRNAFRRAATVAGATGAVLAMTAGSAIAHECFIANRSEEGTAAAGTHSQSWAVASVVDEFFQPALDSGFWTQTEFDCMVTTVARMGVPLEFAVKVKGVNGQDGVLAANNPHASKSSDGQGVDHFFSGYFGQLFQASQVCGAPLPAE